MVAAIYIYIYTVYAHVRMINIHAYVWEMYADKILSDNS